MRKQRSSEHGSSLVWQLDQHAAVDVYRLTKRPANWTDLCVLLPPPFRHSSRSLADKRRVPQLDQQLTSQYLVYHDSFRAENQRRTHLRRSRIQIDEASPLGERSAVSDVGCILSVWFSSANSKFEDPYLGGNRGILAVFSRMTTWRYDARRLLRGPL